MKTIGLLLADSLMRGCSIAARRLLMKNYGLSELHVRCFPGKTTDQLLGGNGEVHTLMQEKSYDYVFLVAGANDFNRNEDDCHVMKCKMIARVRSDLVHGFCTQYPITKLILAPIPMRRLSKNPSMIHDHPECGSQTWIDTTNDAISLYQSCFTVCPCHSNQVRSVISPPLHKWLPYLTSDGLHLTDGSKGQTDGKLKMVQYLLKPKSKFSLSQDDFPPLPEASGKFSFEPQVAVPKMTRKEKPNPNHFILQCCLAQDVSFRGPIKQAAKQVSKSPVCLPKYAPVLRKKQKKPKKADLWFPPVSDYCFSQPNHLPRAKPRVERVKKVSNKDQHREEQPKKQAKRKIPWYERPEFSCNQSEVSRGRGLLKLKSRTDPSPSIKRTPPQLQKKFERDPNLLIKLQQKLTSFKNQRRPQLKKTYAVKEEHPCPHKDNSNDVAGDDANGIDSGLVDDGVCDELSDEHPKMKIPQPRNFSRGHLKKVMKKIKGFLNPMVKSLSKDSKDIEDKISLTYNSKRGCLIQLEKKDGKIETLVDCFTSQNDDEANSSSGFCQRKEISLLLGGKGKRSKSEEARRQKKRREIRAKKLSEAENQELLSKARERMKENYEKNKEKILEDRKLHYDQSKDTILTDRHLHYDQNKDQILTDKQMHYYQNKDQILTDRHLHYDQNKDKILTDKQMHYDQNKDQILTDRHLHYDQNKDKILTDKQLHYDQNKDKILTNRQSHYKENQNDILTRKRASYKEKSVTTAKRYKGAKAHQRNLRLARNLKLTTIRMHDESYRVNRKEIISQFQNFYELIKYGPDFICTICNRSLFENQVVKINKKLDTAVKIGGNQYNCRTNKLSFDGYEYICNSCHANLKSEKMPKYAVVNGNELPFVPPEVKSLNEGEERCVAPRVQFMRVQKLGCDRQRGIKSNVVNVPIDLGKLNLQLPCPRLDNQIMQLHFKRKMEYNHDYLAQNIDLNKVKQALSILAESELYKEAGVEIVTNNFEKLEKINEASLQESMKGMELSGETSSCNKGEYVDIQVDEDDDDDDWDELGDDYPTNIGNDDTMIINEIDELQDMVYARNDLSVAPGEGETPLPMTLDEHCEDLAYPTLNAGEKPKEHLVPMSFKDKCKLQLMHEDNRYRTHPTYPFSIFRKAETILHKNNININMKKGKKVDGASVTAKDVLGNDFQNILKHDGGYKVLASNRCSPAYWQKVKGELFAMVRQLGMPTWFLTFTACETWWPELIQSLQRDLDGKILSEEEIYNMSWEKKVELIRGNAVLCARHFNHRFEAFLKTILKEKLHYDGNLDDYFFRIEFQQRGSPHVHMIMWKHDAPKYGIQSNEEISEYIDKYVKCSISSDDKENVPFHLRCQIHKHTECCKKKGRKKCRFRFPRHPMDRTRIIEPLDWTVYIKKRFPDIDEDVQERLKMQFIQENKDRTARIKKFLDEMDLNDPKFFTMTFQDYLTALEMDFEQYYIAISSTLKRAEVFMKRDLKDVRVNNYNDDLLKAWIGNMDIQYILDPYSVCMYVINYIGKSYRGMSRLLRQVVADCKKKNSSLKTKMTRICKEFQGASEVSAQEVAYDLCQMHKTQSTRTKVFINTYPKNERVKMLKSKDQLKHMKDNDEDIFIENLHSRYSKRSVDDEKLSLADFALGVSGKKRILQYHQYSPEMDMENYARVLLMLFVPWRNEDKLYGDFDTYTDRYLSLKEYLEGKKSELHKIDEQTLESLSKDPEIDDYQDNIVPSLDNDESAAAMVNELQNDGVIDKEHVDLDLIHELGEDYFRNEDVKIKKCTALAEEQNAVYRSLNRRQKEIFYDIIRRVQLSIPIRIMIMGPAGTGKSRLLQAINMWVDNFYSNLRSNDPNSAYSIICAFTGNAAFNSGGLTFHSALGMKINQNLSDDSVFGLISDKRLQQLIDAFANIKFLCADEFTYVGAHMNTKINKHLKTIKQTTSDYGGLDAVFFGDPRQLGPMFDDWIFEPDKKHPCGPIVGDFLFKSFQSFTLSEIMRQDDLAYIQALNDLSDPSSPMKAESVKLFKTREIKEEAISYLPNCRVDYFQENKDVDQHNLETLEKLETAKYDIDAIVTLLGDATKDVKQTLLTKIKTDNNPKATMGLLLHLSLKIGGRYFIPTNICINDGLVNGAIGTLMDIDFSSKNHPLTLWVKFDNEKVGVDARSRIRNSSKYAKRCNDGWTPITKVTKQFPTSRIKIFGMIKQFPLSYGYAFTIAKCQGNNNIGIHTVVHLDKKALSRREQYVAFSRSDELENLHIVGAFTDPYYKEAERRKKKFPLLITEDKVCNAFKELEEREVELVWKPLYKFPGTALKLVFHNVNSILPHLEDILMDLSTMAADVCFFLDSRLKSSDNLSLDGFILKDQITMDNYLRIPGGIVIMAKPDVNVEILQKIHEKTDGYHGTAITCKIDGTIIVAVYFSPKCPLSFVHTCMKKALNKCNDFPKILIGGDFNHKDDIACLLEKGFSNCIALPTTKWMTRIDHLYANFDTEILAWVNPSYFSDHHSIVAILNLDDDTIMTDTGDKPQFKGQYDSLKDLGESKLSERCDHQPIDSFIEENSTATGQTSCISSAKFFQGLQNQHNTCWLNSIFQALWAIFSVDIKFTATDSTDICSAIFNWILSKGNVHFEKLDLYTEKLFDVSIKQAFLMSIGKFEEWRLKSQEDAVEAFQEFINNCDSLSPLGHFQIETYHCPNCESEQSIRLRETIVSVFFHQKFIKQGKFDLNDALRNLFNQFENSEKVCNETECKFQCLRKLVIDGKPRFLMVNLNRAGPNNAKINTACIVAENLVINTTEGPTSFELISVIKHIGSHANAGHYVCYRKSRDVWFEINDASITSTSVLALEKANLFIYKQKVSHQHPDAQQ